MAHYANSGDPDEMPHNAAFNQGLHCLLRQFIDNSYKRKYVHEILVNRLFKLDGKSVVR